MNKTKGALSMVLAGSITFSIISTLLDDPTAKRIIQENVLTISEGLKKADLIKTAKDQTPTTNVKNVQTKLSYNKSAIQADVKHRNKSDIPQSTEKLTKATQTNTVHTGTATTTTSTATTIPASTNQKAANTSTTTLHATTEANPTSETTTTIPATESTTTSSEATTTTNHGQQVSQEVKEKAASRHDQKENNGKKM